MNGLNEFKKGLKAHLEFNGFESFDNSVHNLKMDFMCGLLDITTYDVNSSRIIGEDIVEVLEVINNGNNFEYIKDDNNYRKFIIICNFLEHVNWIEWGSSIRACWLNTELPTDNLYSMQDNLIFKDKQEINNLINYLKSDEI